MYVSDVADGIAHYVGYFDVRFGRQLAGNNRKAAGQQRLEGHTRLWVLLQQLIQHSVADLIRQLVGVTFGYAFGSKEIEFRHGNRTVPFCRWRVFSVEFLVLSV